MKEFFIENIEMIITFITVIVTFINGIICKKASCINNKLIPFENVLIMLLSSGIYWWATGNFSYVVASGSPVATLIYDTYHSLKKMEE